MTRNPAFSTTAPETDPPPPYLRIILRWLAVACAAFVFADFCGVFIIDHFLTKIYMTTALVQLKSGDLSTVRNLVPDVSQEDFNTDFFHHELEVMTSSDILLPIIKDFDLEKVWAKRVYDTEQDAMPDTEALAYMEKILKINFDPKRNIVFIQAASPDAHEAADIANAVADRYKALKDAEETPPGSQGPPPENSVRILERAAVPSVPSKPNKAFDYNATIILAIFLSLCTASFVEIAIMISRASKRPG
jgi:capsular polysaccharide biosynthesis protein